MWRKADDPTKDWKVEEAIPPNSPHGMEDHIHRNFICSNGGPHWEDTSDWNRWGVYMNLCKHGIHRPLSGHQYHFTDTVSGKAVYIAKCPCGKEYLVDSRNGWLGSKTRRQKDGRREEA